MTDDVTQVVAVDGVSSLLATTVVVDDNRDDHGYALSHRFLSDSNLLLSLRNGSEVLAVTEALVHLQSSIFLDDGLGVVAERVKDTVDLLDSGLLILHL